MFKNTVSPLRNRFGKVKVTHAQRGEESQWNETRQGTDDEHVLVVALGVPTYDLAVGLHGALPVGVHVALQRLYNGGADRDVHSIEHRADSTEQCWRELSQARPPELCEMEDRHMQKVTGDHAQCQDDEGEGVSHVSLQRRR